MATETREKTGMSIVCLDCGDTFPWTVEEQEFYRGRELSQPKRCPSCRRWRKFLQHRNERKQESDL